MCCCASVLSPCAFICFYSSFFYFLYRLPSFEAFAGIRLLESVLCAECIFIVQCAHVFLQTCLAYAIKESAPFLLVWLGVPGDWGRGEKVWLRLNGEEVCKGEEGRNNESERGKAVEEWMAREGEESEEWKDQGRHVREQIENANFTLGPTSTGAYRPAAAPYSMCKWMVSTE